MLEASAKPTVNGQENEIVLLYDFECPACDLYCRLLRLPPEAGMLRRVNAREESALLEEVTAAGLDIDQGMVVKRTGRIFYASDAIHELACAAWGSGLFNRFNRALFRSRARSYFLYPLFRSGRNLLLKVLRKTKINNLGKDGNKRF